MRVFTLILAVESAVTAIILALLARYREYSLGVFVLYSTGVVQLLI